MDQLIDMNEEDALAEINLEDTQPQAQQSETQVGNQLKLHARDVKHRPFGKTLCQWE